MLYSCLTLACLQFYTAALFVKFSSRHIRPNETEPSRNLIVRKTVRREPVLKDECNDDIDDDDALTIMTVRACWRTGNFVQVAAVAVWQVRNSTVEVHRGDEFSLTCVVTSLTPIDVVRVVLQRPQHIREPRTLSTVRGEDLEASLVVVAGDVEVKSRSPMLTWTVADNYHVKEPFSSLPRYRLYYSYQDGVATSTLTYRGMCRENGGFRERKAIPDTLLCLKKQIRACQRRLVAKIEAKLREG